MLWKNRFMWLNLKNRDMQLALILCLLDGGTVFVQRVSLFAGKGVYSD